MSSLRSTLWLSGLVIFASTSVVAQTARTGGTANAQLLQQLQELGSERTTLQAENARLQKDLDATRKDRDALKKAQQVQDTRAKETTAALLARAAADKTASQDEVRRLKDQMQELIAKFRETAETLRTVEIEGNAAKQSLAVRERDLQACVDHNQALYKLNDEVLTRLEHQSIWSRAASVEPFTRLERVRLENLVDDYKGRADDQHMKSGAATPAASSAPAAPSVPPAR